MGENVEHTVIQYNEALHQLCRYWHSHYTIPRLHNRAQALYSILHKSESYTTKAYRLNSEFKKLHRHNSALLEDLSQCYGNALQQVLHQEFVDIANMSGEKTITLSLHSNFDDVMPQAIEFGLQANKAGFIEQASKLADICWAMIDVAQAISEGVVEGGKEVFTTAYNVCMHPVQTAGHLLNSIATLGHVMAHAGGMVNELFYYYVTDYEQFYLRQHEIADFLVEIGYKATKDVTSRDLIKQTSKLITETLLFHWMGILISKVCKKAVQIVPVLIQKNEQEPVYALINMPGMKIAQTELMGMETSLATSVAPAMHKNIAKVSCLLDDCAQPISKFLFDLEKKVPVLNKKFATACKGFGELSHKYLTFDFMHIFGIELTYGKNGLKIGGFHKNSISALGEKVIVQLSDIIRKPGGFFKAKLSINGIRLYPSKTFFPSGWSHEKVIQTVVDSYNISIKKGILPVLQADGKFMIDLPINEAVQIRMYITRNGKITSLYPIFLERQAL